MEEKNISAQRGHEDKPGLEEKQETSGCNKERGVKTLQRRTEREEQELGV